MKKFKTYFFGRLLRNFTQNIDTLERVAGIPAEKLVEAHGSFGDVMRKRVFLFFLFFLFLFLFRLAKAACIDCKASYDVQEVKKKKEKEKYLLFLIKMFFFFSLGQAVKVKIDKGELPRCTLCQGLIKPSITFFGENLPKRFAEKSILILKI